MPWGWECRAKLVKQKPLAPTKRRGPTEDFEYPCPLTYEPPQIFCGNGFSHIKRLPAYTFGHNTPVQILKPAAKPNAPLFNVQGKTRKGRYKVPGSVVTPHIEPPSDKTLIPGPGAHNVTMKLYKRPPAYTMSLAAKPPYQPWDQWTPSPNMYCPPIPAKKPPAFSIYGLPKDLPIPDFPGPGEHDANFHVGRRNAPKFAFGPPFRAAMSYKTPSPNTYCNKLFMANKRTIPARSFGIKHSPYAGQQETYLKSENLKLNTIN